MVLHRCFLSSTLRSYNRPFYFFINHLRSCSSSSKILQEHSLKVPSFGGSLWVKSSYNVQVCPTNTMDYPNLDQAFVKVCISLFESIKILQSRHGHLFSIINVVGRESWMYIYNGCAFIGVWCHFAKVNQCTSKMLSNSSCNSGLPSPWSWQRCVGVHKPLLYTKPEHGGGLYFNKN